jgi:membrane protein DedA with SNARE-associated domain
MSEIISQILAWVQNVVASGSYPGLVFVMFLENVFPPIPSEVIMPLAGSLVAQGRMTFLGVWLAGIIGSVLGAVVLYYIGMFAGDVVIRNFLARYGRWVGISIGDYERALSVFHKYGEWIVLIGRVIPLVRSLISIPAGAEHMSMPKFLFFTTLGSAVWSGLLAYAGVLVGENWHEIEGLIGQYQDVTIIVLAVLTVLVIAFFVYRWYVNRNKPSETTPTS